MKTLALPGPLAFWRFSTFQRQRQRGLCEASLVTPSTRSACARTVKTNGGYFLSHVIICQIYEAFLCGLLQFLNIGTSFM